MHFMNSTSFQRKNISYLTKPKHQKNLSIKERNLIKYRIFKLYSDINKITH